MKLTDIVAPRRRIISAIGEERVFPEMLTGDFEGIKKLLGFDMAEFVPLPHYGTEGDWAIMLDEEGKIRGSGLIPVNVPATCLWFDITPERFESLHRSGGLPDVIVGNVAVVRIKDFTDKESEEDGEDDN